jgi:hypothetical protein
VVDDCLAGGADGPRPAMELDDSFHAPLVFRGNPPPTLPGDGGIIGLAKPNRLGPASFPAWASDPAGSAADDDERSAPSGSSPAERSAFLLGKSAPHAGVLARLHGPFKASDPNWASTADGFRGVYL